MIRLIVWLAIGLVAGIIAKKVTPQDEKGGWVSSVIIGIVGSMVGGFIANLTGVARLFGDGIIGSLLIATGGAILVLYIYHKYLADKWKLPI